MIIQTKFVNFLISLMSDLQVPISLTAYKKLMYHCLRYPNSNVLGVLTGSKLQITNAYPLFHTPIVNPTLQIALDLVSAQLEEPSKIIGIYYSNLDNELTEIQQKIFDSIAASSKERAVLVYLKTQGEKSGLEYDVFVGNQREKVEYKQHKFDSIQKELAEGEHRFIIDLDSHFQNVQLDFTNSYI